MVGIMIGSLVINRRRGFRIIDSHRGRSATRSLLPRDNYEDYSPDGSLDSDLSSDYDQLTGTKYPPKKRNCCGMAVQTPNSSRFADHIHSRILQKFPFLIEMFYWALNFVTYACTKAIAQEFFSGNDGLWALAQDHGVLILNIEHASWLKFLFPIRENDFQQWFLNGHLSALTFLNRIYSLVHIPGTVTCVFSLNTTSA